ncbi:heme biosynthesis protein HemY [Lysobacter sp. TY2-98]|uniref:heme biosynthesis protein HemY n=1 Tax=Lysobacter sp. TY2-98 TaxID=2290922 RepID=UPI000E205F67|nr:heme biosynthesis HemY N-terminal domain-containing protein [Lysobacter sp. TY2-98]AXK73329.1 heme biosynthesis protein HemY [Lysobacter sp. TY2-98]
MSFIRSLLLWTVAVLAIALAAQVLLPEPGLVLMRYGGTDYTTTLPRAIAIGLAIFAGAWLLVRLLAAPGIALRRRRERVERARLGAALEDMHLGRWDRAERSLATIDDPDTLAIARVHAARAAAARGEPVLAQQHVDTLASTHPALRAVALAELALAHQRPADALTALDASAAQPLPPRGLALRAQALAELGRYDDAYGMLGALRKADAVPEADLPRLEARWARGALLAAADGNALASRWDSVSSALRHDPAVVAAYAERAAALHWDDAASRAIEQSLDAHWDESLAALYGRLSIGRLDERASRIERWLNEHPGSPGLLMSRARLQYAHGDWLGAESTLHDAIQHDAGPEAWELLGHGYAANGDESRARVAYANALRSARGDALVDLAPDAGVSRRLDPLRDPRGSTRLQ